MKLLLAPLAILQATAYTNTNNIVLKPSSSETNNFDNQKIGMPRVHRYLRDDDSNSSEYVMWYHGRNSSLEKKLQDKMSTATKLAPLSSGRIGRATSKNGLHWEKTTLGSASEDFEGVSLGLNTESWWGFDTAHVGLGNVLLPMTLPSVISEGGVYMMYYMGGTCEEESVATYFKNTNDSSDQNTMGMKMKIGVAVSQDGMTWGRVEGDDATGACVVPDGEELYCAWPDVVPNINQGDFFMYYSTMLKDTKQKAIGVAVSPDGFRWEKRGVCISNTSDFEDDANGCARCTVLNNATYNADTGRWKESSGYTMYYEGISSKDNKHRIMKATSQDGMKWTKQGLVLDILTDDEDSWDFGGVGSPHVVRLDDGSLRMYYTGQSSSGETAIGVAKLSSGSGNDDKTAFVREQANLTFV